MLRFLGFLVVFSVIGLVGAAIAAVMLLHKYGSGLPDHEQLADYEPPTLTRLHAGDGRLLAEYASEKRVFVPIEAMPARLLNAFIAAEDKNFLNHPGIDVVGIVRAAVQNLSNLGQNRRLIGASTITQQVAKNFLLTNEVSLDRKIKEALLAVRIERVLTKDRILELYLNEIFLGQRAYGVAAAAMNYFNESLDELSLSEMAFLAGLPKGPNNYHPERQPRQARIRRDYVLRRMTEDGYITVDDMAAAMQEPIVMRRRGPEHEVAADFFAEEVRRELVARFGEAELYRGGLSVRTTLSPRLQNISDKVLRDGLIAYDRRHGWRGPVAHIDVGDRWSADLARVASPRGLESWRLAVVLDLSGEGAEIGLAAGKRGTIPAEEFKWARPWQEEQKVGPSVGSPADVVDVGDVVLVERLPLAEGEESDDAPLLYGLRQVPDVSGALVALDPHTGRLLAMTGGWSYRGSQFNRASQAKRQPGSAFKPFVYLTALENGFTPTTIVLDAPIVIDQGPGLDLWKPRNYSNRFYGPSTLRVGVEKSRNLMTVRLAQQLGMRKVKEVAHRFGIGDFSPTLSMALGAGETTLLKLTTAYSMLVNGGRHVEPALIERIQDRHGKTIYRRDRRDCARCDSLDRFGEGRPLLVDNREHVTDPITAFQVTWILKGVIDRGTGRRIAALKRPLGGKTGTTNDSFDTWFIGFAPDLAVGVFVGFDSPRTLGPKETGSSVAVPIFKAFMEKALAGQPPVPFRTPSGIRMVRVDGDTGLLPGPGTRRILVEAFKPGTEPTSSTLGGPVIGVSSNQPKGRPVQAARPVFDASLY